MGSSTRRVSSGKYPSLALKAGNEASLSLMKRDLSQVSSSYVIRRVATAAGGILSVSSAPCGHIHEWLCWYVCVCSWNLQCDTRFTRIHESISALLRLFDTVSTCRRSLEHTCLTHDPNKTIISQYKKTPHISKWVRNRRAGPTTRRWFTVSALVWVLFPTRTLQKFDVWHFLSTAELIFWVTGNDVHTWLNRRRQNISEGARKYEIIRK